MTAPGDRILIHFDGDPAPTPAIIRGIFHLDSLSRRWTSAELLTFHGNQSFVDAIPITDPRRFSKAGPNSWIGIRRDDQPGYIAPATLAAWGVIAWALVQLDSPNPPSHWDSGDFSERQIRAGTYSFAALQCADGSWRDPAGRQFHITQVLSQPALAKQSGWQLEDAQPPLDWKEAITGMTPHSLGKVTVPTPGTSVKLAVTATPCNRIRVQVIAGLSGKMYFGVAPCSSASLTGVIKELWPNSGGGISDAFEIWTADGTDQLDLSHYAVDAAIAGEGLIVAYWVA